MAEEPDVHETATPRDVPDETPADTGGARAGLPPPEEHSPPSPGRLRSPSPRCAGCFGLALPVLVADRHHPGRVHGDDGRARLREVLDPFQ